MKTTRIKTRGSRPVLPPPKTEAPSALPGGGGGGPLDDATRRYFIEQGRLGGTCKSDAKINAALENIEKANEARWGKKYKGKIANRLRRRRGQVARGKRR